MTSQITKKSATDSISEINEALKSLTEYVAMQEAEDVNKGVPHITIEQANAIWSNPIYKKEGVEFFNKRIDAYGKANEQPLITAEEAKKLGVGKAELFNEHTSKWEEILNPHYIYPRCNKYRAIKQTEPTFKEIDLAGAIARISEPVEPHAELKALYAQQVKDGTLKDFVWEVLEGDVWMSRTVIIKFYEYLKYRCTPKPTCQVKNLDTGELKTMTREAAKLLQTELGDTVEWFVFGAKHEWDGEVFAFDSKGIYTYKLKANLVKLDGEFMTREAAIALWESKKDTCYMYYKSDNTEGFVLLNKFTRNGAWDWNAPSTQNAEYQLRPKSIKQVSWKYVPVGVMTTFGGLRSVHGLTATIEIRHGKMADAVKHEVKNLELAPASEQPWIAVQDGVDGLELVGNLRDKGFEVECYVYASKYRITGIAKGYELK